jgi:hypothetical protein
MAYSKHRGEPSLGVREFVVYCNVAGMPVGRIPTERQ